MSSSLYDLNPAPGKMKRGMSKKKSSFNIRKNATEEQPVGGVGLGKRGKSMMGIQLKQEDPSIRRHRAKNDLLPMVMDSLVYGPMISASRQYMKVLVADSNEEVLRIVSEYLILKGCEVATSTAEPAVRDLLLTEDFDVAFINFDVGGGDGLSVIGSFVEQMERDAAAGLHNNKDNPKNNDFELDENGSLITSRNISNSKLTTPNSHRSVDDAKLVYNENMLLVGMGDYPNDRIEEAKKNGMNIFCPSNPISVEFIGKIITVWRTCDEKYLGISEILKHSPLASMDYQIEQTNAIKDKALRLSLKGRRPGKEKGILDTICSCFCPASTSNSKIYSVK